MARDASGGGSAGLLADLAESQIAARQFNAAWDTIDDGYRVADSAERGRLEELQRIVTSAMRSENVLR